IFSVTTFNYDTLSERLREAAFLMKGLTIELIDERYNHRDRFFYETGIEAFIDYLNEDKETLHSVVMFEGMHLDIQVEIAFQYNDGFTENILSFVNNVRTKDGGTHESGAKTAMTRIMNDY